MDDMNLYPKPIMKMLSQMLRRINAAVLATRTAKAEHQMRETTLYIARHMMIGQLEDLV